MSPFEIVPSKQPLTAPDIAQMDSDGIYPATHRMARARCEILQEARDSLLQAAKRMEYYANLH